MLRETKTFEIDGLGKPITVYELTVEELIGLLSGTDGQGHSVEDLKSLLIDQVLPRATDISQEDLMRLGPSRIQQVWEEIKKVNSAFFALARHVGLVDLADQLKGQFIENFSSQLASSLRRAMPTSGDTDSDTSSTLSINTSKS